MHITVKIARTIKDLESVFRIRFRVFVDEFGFIPREEFPAGLENDIYDSLSSTTHFLAECDGNGVGCARLIGPNTINENRVQDNRIFGLPMEKLFDLSDFVRRKIIPYEISRSAVVSEARSSRTIMNIWKICVMYGKKKKLSFFCTCAGTETDSPMDAKVIYLLLRHKGFLHPDISTPSRKLPEIAYEPKYHLYEPKIAESLLGRENISADEWDELEKKDVRLPATLDYFTRLGGKVTGPPCLFRDFKMYTIPMLFDINNLNEPFRTFFDRESEDIKI